MVLQGYDSVFSVTRQASLGKTEFIMSLNFPEIKNYAGQKCAPIPAAPLPSTLSRETDPDVRSWRWMMGVISDIRHNSNITGGDRGERDVLLYSEGADWQRSLPRRTVRPRRNTSGILNRNRYPFWPGICWAGLVSGVHPTLHVIFTTLTPPPLPL